VRYAPQQRFASAGLLANRMRQVIDRLKAGGRPLNLSSHIPQRCAWCAAGGYKPLAPLPRREQRITDPDPRRLPYERPDIYKSMRDEAEYRAGFKVGGGVGSGAPLILICQHCGHQQIFRLDLVPSAAKEWKP
jgi:hypothetical protein